jgi:thymidine kinase
VAGRLVVITGPMASGKTMHLIDLLRREQIAGSEVILFKHDIDVRCDSSEVKSRFGLSWPALSISVPDSIWSLSGEAQVVGIEEAQFFDENLVDVISSLLYGADTNVYVTGLNQNFRGEPFGIMPTLMAMADEIYLLSAVCSICGRKASKTQRILDGNVAPADSPTILVGGDETYEPRCSICWEKPR